MDELAADRKYVFFEGAAYKRMVTADQKITSAEIARQKEFREEALQARELQVVPNMTAEDLSLDKRMLSSFSSTNPFKWRR